jgi:hypothetical protein
MSMTNGTMTIIPAPEGYLVDFDNPQVQFMAKSYTVAAVEMTLAFLFLLQRLYTKIVIVKKFQLEDGKSLCKRQMGSCSVLTSSRCRHCCLDLLLGHPDMSASRNFPWSYWEACLGNQY